MNDNGVIIAFGHSERLPQRHIGAIGMGKKLNNELLCYQE